MRKLSLILLLGFVLTSPFQFAGTAGAEGLGYRGWGVRGGVSVDPDQFFVGAHLDLGEFTKNLSFMPNATIGFGDDMTLVSINPDVSYHFPVPDLGSLYVGGLLDFQWWKIDVPEVLKPYVDETDTDVGFHIQGGLELTSTPLLFELNVGIEDAPDLKAAVGYTFR